MGAAVFTDVWILGDILNQDGGPNVTLDGLGPFFGMVQAHKLHYPFKNNNIIILFLQNTFILLGALLASSSWSLQNLEFAGCLGYGSVNTTHF